MSQLTLFESSETRLADDERGRVVYTPRFIDADTADSWFKELRDGLTWSTQRRVMYDREVDVPRLMAHFRLEPEGVELPAPIAEAARLVSGHLSVRFNSVGLNRYRDGRDSVAAHNDHLDEIRAGFPIALLSLGAIRQMVIRAKAQPRTTIHVDLEAGSLLVMDYATQVHYTHAIPKTTDTVGERISLAFRVKRHERAASF
jgi:alkylated DNA repair dioxygenase AlkB